jgi:glycosyltransferase involved in cell wall biosynthesis
MVHPGSELYGADRMFLLSLKAVIVQYPSSRIDINLPHPGPLVSEIQKISSEIQITFCRMGILRKSDFKKLNFKALIDIACFFRLKKKLSSYDLVYINTIVIADYLLAARWAGTRVITHVHELPVGSSRFVFKKLLSFSRSELIYISRAVKNCFSPISNPLQYVIWNGIPEVTEHVNVKNHAPKTPIHILMVGRINSWKGQSLLVEATSLLNESEKGRIRVTLLGDVYGNQYHFKEKLVEQITKHDLQNIIQLQPFQADPEKYYNEADVVVVPSLLPEPFGLVAVEAMRAGKPVIAAKHGGLEEIVQDGLTGILFKPGDPKALASAISFIINNTDHAETMGIAGYERYLQYFTENKYLQSLTKILTCSSKN